MKWIFVTCAYAVILYQVLAAPPNRLPNDEGDSVEQELVRNHHSAALQRLKSTVNKASDETDESSPVESIEEVEDSEDENDRSITEDDLYDITVGDVIRDVLLTLRDHPEIVKELIASEKEKLAQQIDAFNSLVDGDSAGDSLAGFMNPAEQLNSVPKSVEKKAGRSGMAVIPGQQIEQKRTDEVINDAYTRDTDSAEAQQYKDFMQQPVEGGQNAPMFDYENSHSQGTNSKEWSYDSEIGQKNSRETISDSSESYPTDFTENKSSNEHENDQTQENSDKDSTKSGSSHTETADDGSNESQELNSEQELAWLLHQSRTRNAAEKTSNEAGVKRYIKM